MLQSPAMTLEAGVALNPWRTIWFSPRRTIRSIVSAEARPSWVPVIALMAVVTAFTSVQLEPDTGSVSVSRSFVPVAVGVLQLVFGVLVGPFLLAIVGGWLGGDADPGDIRQGVAWSYVPAVTGGLIWLVVMLSLFGVSALDTEALEQAMDGLVQTDSLPLWQAALVGVVSLLIVVGVAWTFVLHIAMLAELQRFNIWRALACVLILLVPFLLIGALA